MEQSADGGYKAILAKLAEANIVKHVTYGRPLTDGMREKLRLVTAKPQPVPIQKKEEVH